MIKIDLDRENLIRHIIRFEEYVRERDGNYDKPISFSDTSRVLGDEEYYKTKIAKRAKEALRYAEWNKDMIGTGEIANRVRSAIGHAGNLIFSNNQTNFRDRLDPSRKEFEPTAEQVLYEIYCGESEEEAFSKAMEVFGAKYPTMAYLFFIKDCTRFLPVSPDNFDKSFALLGSDFRMSHKCSWDNYTTFIRIVQEVQMIMSEVIESEEPITLLDAHSFLWIIRSDETYTRWTESVDIDAEIAPAIDKEMELLPLCGEEREAVRKERVNQGIFRKMLFKSGNSCVVCGLSNPALLTASHIKPWKSSRPEEKLDSHNGFLMCPNHDKLFDKGFISFDDDGHIMIASALNRVDSKLLNVDRDMKIALSEENNKYLQYHRQHVFNK